MSKTFGIVCLIFLIWFLVIRNLKGESLPPKQADVDEVAKPSPSNTYTI